MRGYGVSVSTDGIPATATVLSDPNDVKLDTFGNLYIVESRYGQIKKVDISSGIISNFAGTGLTGLGIDNVLATTSNLGAPVGICFDKKGNLYVSESGGAYRVRKISPDGIITTFAGIGGSMGMSGDNGPATNAQLVFPLGLVADDTGNIYISDISGLANRVRKVDTFGIITTVVGNGVGVYSGDGIPATDAQISGGSLAMDADDNLYIADKYNKRVYKVGHDGILHNVAGNGATGFSGMGGPATAAPLAEPVGVTFDRCGNMYIPTASLLLGNRILRVDFDPTCSITGACGGSLSANIPQPSNSIILFPNPVSASVTIRSNEPIEFVSITNVLGRNVYENKFSNADIEIPVSDFKVGIYFVKVTDKDGLVKIFRLIKE